MSWISFRGVSTASLTNVLVKKMPDHAKADMRYTAYRIKGRDGEVRVNEGYGMIDLNIELVLFKASALSRQIINAWADGTGRLITSDDNTRAYMATAKGISWSRDYNGGVFYDVASIDFLCQPIMREAVESTQTFTADGSCANLGTVESYPLIAVYGSGECVFSIAGNEITLTDVDANTPVMIDSDTGYVYTTDGAAEMTGEFPVLGLGDNAVVLGSNVTKIVITPRWGWI